MRQNKDKPKQTGVMTRMGRGFREGSRGMLHRISLDRLIGSRGERFAVSTYALICGTISIGVMAVAAWMSHSPLIFASLGPSAFLFYYAPRSFSAAPRSAIMGHFIGAVVGYASLRIFFWNENLHTIDHATMDWRFICTAAFSLGVTSAIMVFLDSPHPPAGSTTLLFSLGLFNKIDQIAFLMLAVIMLTIISVLLNRLAGMQYSIWPGKRERMYRE